MKPGAFGVSLLICRYSELTESNASPAKAETLIDTEI
jgi:hypothetical protein